MKRKRENSPMRLLIFSAYYYPHKGGVETYIKELFKGLDVTIITCNTEKSKFFENVDGFKVYRYECHNLLNKTYPILTLNSLRKIKHFVEKNKNNFDYIITHTRFFQTSLIATILAKKYYIKQIHFEHGTEHSPIKNPLLNIFGKLYDHIIARYIIKNSTKLLTDFCIKHNARFIDISTSEVYGQSGPLVEDSPKHIPGEIAVRTEYGVGKLLGEIQTINKARVEPRLKYHIIRPFNISGPRQKPDNGFVLPRFVIAGLTDQPITVFGDGSQERAFTYVKDMAEAIILIAESKYENDVWNIGNPDNRTTILKLANMVAKEVKIINPKLNPRNVFLDGKEIHGPLFEEVPDKLPDITKIKTKLKWEPKVSLQQVVKETVEFYDPLVKKGLNYKMQ